MTMRVTPAARARATTASTSPAKSGKSRWQWLSTSVGGHRICAAAAADQAARGKRLLRRRVDLSKVSRITWAGSRCTARAWSTRAPSRAAGSAQSRACAGRRRQPGHRRRLGARDGGDGAAGAGRARRASASRIRLERQRRSAPGVAPGAGLGERDGAAAVERRRGGEERRRSRRRARRRRPPPAAAPRRPSRRPARPGRGGPRRRGAGGGERARRRSSAPSGRQAQHAAARADGRQQPRRLVADEQERRARRRLLEDLQERVGGGVVQLVGGVDDRDPPAAVGGGELEEALERPHLVDGDRGLQPLAPCRPRAGGRGRAAGGRARRPGGRPASAGAMCQAAAGAARQQVAGDAPGERRLADAARAGDQPAVMRPPGGERRQELRLRRPCPKSAAVSRGCGAPGSRSGSSGARLTAAPRRIVRHLPGHGGGYAGRHRLWQAIARSASSGLPRDGAAA